MPWGYRVLKKVIDGEAHYVVINYQPGPIAQIQPIVVSGESLSDLRWTLERMLEALNRPVLEDNNAKLSGGPSGPSG